MRCIRTLAAAGVALTLAALGPALAASASTTPTTTATATRQWTANFSAKDQYTNGYAVAASPNGSTVYVAGAAEFGEAVAYNAATGATVWKYHLNSDSKILGSAFKAIAVSPNGSTVFVTGSTQTVRNGPPCQAIVALNAATGAKLWQVVSTGTNYAYSSPVAVSPDGSTVYVSNVGLDQTAAYNAATGAALWTEPGGGFALALSPDGGTLFITEDDARTVEAFNASTGATDWQMSLNGQAEAVSPDGATLFVTGTPSSGGRENLTTTAIATGTGTTLWSVATGRSRTFIVNAVAATGAAVVVSAMPAGSGGSDPFWRTVALAPQTGTTLWSKTLHGGTSGVAYATGLVLSPDGFTAYVTGFATHGASSGASMLTAGYDIATGATTWTAHYDGQAYNQSEAIGVSPDGSQVFITGSSGPVDATHSSMTTVAYSTS
jgi:outer membrane protein assembly factor BamB